MPPPIDDLALNLRVLDETYSILQLKPNDPIPADLLNLLLGKDLEQIPGNGAVERFISITRTSEEISIVYDRRTSGSEVPQWKCIKIKGPMHLGLTGIMCDFTTPLKYASVPVFALSTWNTDYVLVPKEKTNDAVAALKADGWIFEE